jgi:hypothetical protein
MKGRASNFVVSAILMQFYNHLCTRIKIPHSRPPAILNPDSSWLILKKEIYEKKLKNMRESGFSY